LGKREGAMRKKILSPNLIELKKNVAKDDKKNNELIDV